MEKSEDLQGGAGGGSKRSSRGRRIGSRACPPSARSLKESPPCFVGRLLPRDGTGAGLSWSYQGGIGCLRIPFTRGVCEPGAHGAAQVCRTSTRFPATSPATPSRARRSSSRFRDRRGEVVAVLDLDSREPARVRRGGSPQLEMLIESCWSSETRDFLDARLPQHVQQVVWAVRHTSIIKQSVWCRRPRAIRGRD